MIGSFWNLCRACPSMPVDKLHSEYRSTYRWHEYTGSRQEVVRRPPQPNPITMTGRKMEPAMPRRKKHPELAYRTHEFITYEDDGISESGDVAICPDRARSEERAGFQLRSSRRSRSEGPPRGSAMSNISCRNEITRRRDSDPDLMETMNNVQGTDDGGLLRKAISKISTEYRLQFAWPSGHNSRADSHHSKENSLPRKSLSMGAIKPSPQSIVHKKHNDVDTKDVSELEPLVNDSGANPSNKNTDKVDGKLFNAEFKKKKPLLLQDNIPPVPETRIEKRNIYNVENETPFEISENGPKFVLGKNADWFKEVVELRKKADEYKFRGWGTELAPEHITELYNKQIELWEQVSRRSSLSALSLASTTRKSFTKEEKDEENNKKNSPVTNSCWNSLDTTDYATRTMREIIRHHLERTTGGTEHDGLILSPTREKLEPTPPKKHDDHGKNAQKEHIQKFSPKKDSPQKLKKKMQKTGGTKPTLRTIRSQSVGPADVTEKSSPKRLSRSSTAKQRNPRESATSPLSNITRRQRQSDPVTVQNKCITPPEEDMNSEFQANIEHVVKSPPEPTRVKSPEQIIMRSPDPVNWTVPLDTGKTFTVTQNVREGELMNRPHSEVKVWTPPDIPPPAAQSAPPELAEQAKLQGISSIINA